MSNSRNTGLAADALHDVQLLDVGDVDALAWTDVPGSPGVAQKVLWHLGGFTQALIRYQPGTSTPGEPHLAAHHHIWVTEGALTLAGRRLTAGSYAHVPPGAPHAARDAGPEGCTLLQMHRPHPPRESEVLTHLDRVLAPPYIPPYIPPQPTTVTNSALRGSGTGRSAARLRLGVVELPDSAQADGVWWPRSLDLVAELQPLLAALPTEGRHARGVMYSLTGWQVAPNKVTLDGRVVKLGGYRMLPPDVVHLTASGASTALVLRVLPPSTDPAVAAAALAAVGAAPQEPAAGPAPAPHTNTEDVS